MQSRHYPDWAVIFETILAYIEENRITELKNMLRRELRKLKDTDRAHVPLWDAIEH